MTIRIAINGYGRIGRCILRALYELDKHDIKVVAINDLGDAKTMAHLTRYDTAHGRFNADVSQQDNVMTVNGDDINIYHEKDPAQLPWKSLDVDVVMECTGLF